MTKEEKVLQDAEKIICEEYLKYLEETNFGVYSNDIFGDFNIKLKDVIDWIPWKKLLYVGIATSCILANILILKRRKT